jgi:hypothetical protein
MTKRSIEKEMQNAAIASSNPKGALCLGQAIKVGTAWDVVLASNPFR